MAPDPTLAPYEAILWTLALVLFALGWHLRRRGARPEGGILMLCGLAAFGLLLAAALLDRGAP